MLGMLAGRDQLMQLNSHIRRMSTDLAPVEALEMLALQIILNSEPIFDPRIARGWIKAFEPSEVNINGEFEGDGISKNSPRGIATPTLGLISKLGESGLLIRHRKNQMRFTHPVFCGYLAGKSLAKFKSESLLNQPSWIGKYLAFQFMAVFGDLNPVVDKFLSKVDRPLSRKLLIPARWLRYTGQANNWREQIIKKLYELLKETGQPLGLRGQALCALIQCGNLDVAVRLRQLLEEQDNDLLILAALGCGALKDIQAIEMLSFQLSNKSPNVRRAACLALVSIGTTTAMDRVASSLLQGDDILRRAAAEALANHPGEGFLMLKEGAELKDDILVRRAVVYGLGRIPEPWAENLVDRLQNEDTQWAVRTAAAEVVEARGSLNPHIPQRLSPPTETPWIIAFAAKQGLGVSPDKPPSELLLTALKSGTEEQRLASLAYFRMIPAEEVFEPLYQAMFEGEPTLREAAFLTLSEIAARGVDVPDPVQIGVG